MTLRTLLPPCALLMCVMLLCTGCAQTYRQCPDEAELKISLFSVQGLEAVEQAMKNTDLKDVVWISQIKAVQEKEGVTVELTAQTFSHEDILLDDMFLYVTGLHVEA